MVANYFYDQNFPFRLMTKHKRLSEWILWQQIDRRIWNPSHFDWQLFVLLICIDKNTQVFNFTNGHFWPMLLLSVCSSAALCLPLQPFSLTPHSILPVENLRIHINTLLIWWDSIIVINWLKVNSCFTWGSLTIDSCKWGFIFGCILICPVAEINQS